MQYMSINCLIFIEVIPIAKEQIKNSAGYGVFSNINTHIFFLSSGKFECQELQRYYRLARRAVWRVKCGLGWSNKHLAFEGISRNP